jgi:hypothetical protein
MRLAGKAAAFFFNEMKKNLDDLIFGCIMSKVLTISLTFNLIGQTNIRRIFRFTEEWDVFASFPTPRLRYFVKAFNKLCEKLIRSTLLWPRVAPPAR